MYTHLFLLQALYTMHPELMPLLGVIVILSEMSDVLTSQKTNTMKLSRMKSLIHLVKVSACDRQTGIQTDRQSDGQTLLLYSYRAKLKRYKTAAVYTSRTRLKLVLLYT